MRYTEIDRQIERLASKQHGAFSRQQAFTIGASERFVSRRLAERHWTRPAPGVYVLASSQGTWLRQAKSAELSVPGSALAGFAAAAHHEIPGFKRGSLELLIPAHANSRNSVARCHRYTGAKLTVVNGIAVTDLAQTIADLSLRIAMARLERAMDDSLASGKVKAEQLLERVTFYEGSRRPGLPVLRALVSERTDEGWEPPATELEAKLFELIARLSPQPRVVRQAAFPWRPSAPNRVDALLPDYGLIIEADGRRWHTRVADFDNDRWRDNEATSHGLATLRYTWTHLTSLADTSLELLARTLLRRAT